MVPDRSAQMAEKSWSSIDPTRRGIGVTNASKNTDTITNPEAETANTGA